MLSESGAPALLAVRRLAVRAGLSAEDHDQVVDYEGGFVGEERGAAGTTWVSGLVKVRAVLTPLRGWGRRWGLLPQACAVGMASYSRFAGWARCRQMARSS